MDQEKNTKAMIKAQGDLYMVVLDSKSNSLNDNTLESIRQSSLKKSEIQQAAVRIISFLLNSYTYRKQIKETIDQKIPVFPRPILKSVYLNQALLDTFDSRKNTLLS